MVASSSETCSCWPVTSTAPRSVDSSTARVQRAPFTKTRPRPARVTTRRTRSSTDPSSEVSPAGRPALSTRASAGWSPGSSKIASTEASSAPSRRRSALMRPPRTRWSAPTSRDLPAPVSPVSTFRPGPKCTSTWSTTAKPVIRRVVSMGGVCHRPLTLRKLSGVDPFSSRFRMRGAAPRALGSLRDPPPRRPTRSPARPPRAGAVPGPGGVLGGHRRRRLRPHRHVQPSAPSRPGPPRRWRPGTTGSTSPPRPGRASSAPRPASSSRRTASR